MCEIYRNESKMLYKPHILTQCVFIFENNAEFFICCLWDFKVFENIVLFVWFPHVHIREFYLKIDNAEKFNVLITVT